MTVLDFYAVQRDASRQLSQIFFFGLFPVFFIYHSLAAFEVISVPLPLGGLWMNVNILAAAVLGALILPHLLQNLRRHIGVVALVSIMGALVVYHYVDNSRPFDRTISAAESLKLVLSLVSLYSIGFFMRSDDRFTSALLASLAMMAVVVPFLVQTDPFSPLDDDRRRFNGQVASYAWFATAIVFTGLAAFAYSRSWRKKSSSVALTLFGLLLVGGRSELVGFVFVLCVLVGGYFLWSRSIPWRLVVAACVLGAIAVAAVAILLPDVFSRYTEMFDLSRSRSWQERASVLSAGLEQIRENPLLGAYGAYIKSDRDFGSYVHNALSMWTQFGAVAFILYIGLCFRCFYGSARAMLRGAFSDGAWLFTFLASTFCLLLIVISKSVFWPLPALAWGLYASAKSSEPSRLPRG